MCILFNCKYMCSNYCSYIITYHYLYITTLLRTYNNTNSNAIGAHTYVAILSEQWEMKAMPL